MCKDWCPQCKKPFDYLLTHRQLDGTLTDYLAEESVVLLKRARWFEDYVKVSVMLQTRDEAQQCKMYGTWVGLGAVSCSG